MRTDALYALSVFDKGTLKNSPFQGDETYVSEMKVACREYSCGTSGDRRFTAN